MGKQVAILAWGVNNIDPKTVASFGDEWSRFDQTGMSDDEACKVFEESHVNLLPQS